PAIGALAAEIGTEVVFTAAGIATIGVTVAVISIPDVTARETNRIGEIVRSMVARPVVFAALLVSAPSIMFGAVAVLVPLQIDALGGTSVLVAAGFASGALLEAALAPIVGAFSDRRGR